MKKILFFINTLNGGGAEKVLVDTVNSLDSGKYQITVQTVFDGGINKKYLSPNIRYKSINIAIDTYINLLTVDIITIFIKVFLKF